MANDLQTKLDAIKLDKDTNLLPENLKAGVTCLGITGTLTAGEDLQEQLNAQDLIIQQLQEEVAHKASGGEVKLNIFMQETEPEAKDGIWINSIDKKEVRFVRTIDYELSGLTDSDITLPISFTKGQAAIIGNDLWIVEGINIYTYNLDTKSWTKHADLPYTFVNSNYMYGLGNTLQHDDEYLYIPHGYSESTIIIMKYNITDDTCSTTTFNIGTNADPAGLCLTDNGKLYWIGWQTSGIISESNIMYRRGMAQLDFDTGTIITKNPVPTTHCYAGNVVALGNKIYLIGSANSLSNSPMDVSKFIYVYDTESDTYKHIFTSDINIFNSTSVLYRNYIICILLSQQKVLLINTNNNNVYWSNVSVPANLTYAQSAIYNDKLFIIGGTDNDYGVKMAEISIADVFSNMIYIANPDSNTNSNTDKYIKLIDNYDILTGINDVICTDSDGNINNMISKYYGNGTEWIQI